VIYLLKKNDIRTAQMNEMEFEIKKLILSTVVKKVKMKISEPVDNAPPSRYFGNLCLSCEFSNNLFMVFWKNKFK
jgi:hypothetical protein